jgi:hypothetical protein
MPEEPNEDVDSRKDRELKEAAARRSSGIVRADDAGAPTADAPAFGEPPEPVESSTAAGNPVAGREIGQADATEAVGPSSDS